MAREARIAALRAMANQTASPEEALIAQEKLRRYASFTAVVQTREQVARAERQRQHEADEAARLALVKRFERGGFKGVTIRAGAGGLESRFR